MTVSLAPSAEPLAADGVATAFPFTFKALATGDLKVVTVAADGTETTVSPVDYTVTLAAAGGGTVTFSVAPANGLTVFIRNNRGYQQSAAIKTHTKYRPDENEAAIDSVAVLLKQLHWDVSRCFKVAEAQGGDATLALPGSMSLPAARAGGILGFDATGGIAVVAGDSGGLLVQDGTNSLGVRNGLNAMVFSVYRTYDSSTGLYERLTMDTKTGTMFLRTEQGNGGSPRPLAVGPSGAGVSLFFNTGGTNRWEVNDLGSLCPILLNAYDIGDPNQGIKGVYYGTNNVYVDYVTTGVLRQSGGTTAQKYRIYGTTTGPKYMELGCDASTGYVDMTGASMPFTIQIGASSKWFFNHTSFEFGPVPNNTLDIASASTVVRSIYFGTRLSGRNDAATIALGGAEDVILARDAANILALKNGANAQTFRIYGTTVGPVYTYVTNSGTFGVVSTNSGGLSIVPAGTFLTLGVGGASLWQYEATLFYPNTDNVYDIGKTANRVRSGYFGTSVVNGSGAVGTPSYTFGAATTTGMYLDTGDISFSRAGTLLFAISANGVVIEQTSGVFGALLVGDGSNVLAQKNSTSAQKFRVYGTTTGPKYVELGHDGTDSNLDSQSGNLYFRRAGTIFWGVTASAFSPAATDNSLDVAASGNRARNIYFGTQALGSDGTATNPAYSFISATNTGLFRLTADGSINFATAGTSYVAMYANALSLASTTALYWSASGTPSGGIDVAVVRDAAAVLALKNGTNAQTFRVYGTTTGPKYQSIGHDGTDGFLDSVGGGAVNFKIAGTAKWSVTSGGNYLAVTDNANDVGATGANRPRTLYLGTSLVIGANATITGTVVNAVSNWTLAVNGTLTGSPADFNLETVTPTLAGAFTVTRLNYFDINNVAGAATVTDAAIFRFNAATGTHKALASNAAVAVTITSVGPTGAQTTIQGWMKINVNGTLRYVPFW